MKKDNDPFEGMFDNLHNETLPTNEQKEKMLNHVLMNSKLQDDSTLEKIGKWISIYPWRFAFSAAAAQAIVLTIIFGTEYTNFLLKVFGE